MAESESGFSEWDARVGEPTPGDLPADAHRAEATDQPQVSTSPQSVQPPYEATHPSHPAGPYVAGEAQRGVAPSYGQLRPDGSYETDRPLNRADVRPGSSGFGGWDSTVADGGDGLMIPRQPTADEIRAENLAALPPVAYTDSEGDQIAFKLEDLAGVLRILRLVKLYQGRDTRQHALDMLNKMGLGVDPEVSGLVRYGMYRPSPAEQLLADYAATTV